MLFQKTIEPLDPKEGERCLCEIFQPAINVQLQLYLQSKIKVIQLREFIIYSNAVIYTREVASPMSASASDISKRCT